MEVALDIYLGSKIAKNITESFKNGTEGVKNISESFKNVTEGGKNILDCISSAQDIYHKEVMFRKNIENQEKFGDMVKETNKIAVETSNELHEYRNLTNQTLATHSEKLNNLEIKFEHISGDITGLKSDVRALDCRIDNVQNQVTNLSNTVNYINSDLQNHKIYTNQRFMEVYHNMDVINTKLENHIVNTQREFHNVYKTINHVNKDLQGFKVETRQNFKIVENQIQQTNKYFSERCNELANRILQDEIIAQKNNEAINARFESNEIHINNLYYMGFNNQQKISYLFELSKKDSHAISIQAALIDKNFEISKTCIENIQVIYHEIGNIIDGINAVQEEVGSLAQNQQIMKDVQDKIIAHSNLMSKKINEITQVLNIHTQIIAEHSLQIAKLEEFAVSQNKALQMIFKEVQGNRSIISNHEERIQNIEKIIGRHEEWLLALDKRTTLLKVSIDSIIDKIKEIEFNQFSKECKNATMNTKMLIDQMDEEQNRQFMEFLIYAKHSQIEFSPTQIYQIAINIRSGNGW